MKLVCFGDSFIDSDHPGPGLASLIAEQLRLPLVNFGQTSTGITYSLNCLYRYLISSSYDAADVFIFVPSAENRLWFEKLGSDKFALPGEWSIDPRVRDFSLQYANEIIWTIDHAEPSLEIKTLHAFSLMQAMAARGHRCLVINPFSVSTTAQQILRTFTKTENFRPLAIQPGLMHYSIHEFAEPSEIIWANEYLYNRCNHFSLVNLEILAEQLAQELKGIDAFDPRKLRQAFLT